MKLLEHNLVEGTFIEESKNRFIGKVLVDGVIQECYISSSSRLESLINLKGKRVLLSTNHRKDCRTKYSLYSVFYRNKQILLNLNIVNELFGKIVEAGQYKEYFEYSSILRETTIQGYKADLFIEGKEKIIIENKAIISVRKTASFPTIHSERAIIQLRKLNAMLADGYRVFYNIIALSPFVREVEINCNEIEYYNSFVQCINNGMCINGYKLYYDNNSLKSKRIRIHI